jgi:transposase-like protein
MTQAWWNPLLDFGWVVYCSPLRNSKTKGVKWLERKAAMNRRQWDAKSKATIVLQGLRGKPVSEICNEHQISQSEYYRWREQFLAGMPQIFGDNGKREASLAKENAKLKNIIGELTLELKKLNEWPE